MKKCISLVALWDYLQGKNTQDGAEICVTTESKTWDGNWPAPNEEVPEGSYFDLKKNGATLCMDGEECECTYDSAKDSYMCRSPESDMSFQFTADEFGACTFN